MSLFTTLDARRQIQSIDGATSYVIYAAPGLQKPIADALATAARRLLPGHVQVVLDPSANVARLGYGDFEVFSVLAKSGIAVRKHDGLRLGVLICDGHGWSFASAPRLVEKDPTSDTDAYNAISLTETQILALLAELPPLGVAGSTSESIDRRVPPVVGEEQVTTELLESVAAALKIAPPQPFDLARQTQIYAALIQFVELKFEGFNIQSKKVQLPPTLPLLSSKDKKFKARLTASLKVLDKIDKPAALTEITAALEDLRDAYLMPVGHAGRIMIKSKRPDFEKELAEIEQKLKKSKDALKLDLEKAMSDVIDSITPELARAVLADPPSRFRGVFEATESGAKAYVDEELRKHLPSADKLVDGMRIHKFYKDVTYETLKNDEFRKRVLEQLPKSVIDGSLLNERTAAIAGKTGAGA